MSCVTYIAVRSSSRPRASTTAMAKSWMPPLPLHNPSALGRCPRCWTSLRLRHHPSCSRSPHVNFHPQSTTRHRDTHNRPLRETSTRTIRQLPPGRGLKAARQWTDLREKHRTRNRLLYRLLQPRSAASPLPRPLLRPALRSAAPLPPKPPRKQRSADVECRSTRCRRRIRPFPSPHHLRCLQPRKRLLCCGPRRRRQLVRLRRFCFNIRARPSLHAMELRGGRRTSLTMYPLRARVSVGGRSR